MFQNIRVDVIYHKTNTDFEMEFNLCGCCRMRLLTDKTPDKKSFIHSLARAVSRSRIIIIIGSLFGTDNTVSMVSDAIGSGVSVIDNNLYGIKGENEISILRGSTPLITSDGYFGGCIIESGPQTMILLSDSKSVRKTIMSTLIHPYIEELYASDLDGNEKGIEPEDTSEEPKEENTMILEGFEEESTQEETSEPDMPVVEVLEETEPEESETTVDKTVLTDEEEPVLEETAEEISEEIPMERDLTSFADSNYVQLDEYEEEYVAETYVEPKKEKKPLNLRLPILITTIVLLVLLALLCYCIFYVPSSEGVSAGDYIKEIYDTLFPEV